MNKRQRNKRLKANPPMWKWDMPPTREELCLAASEFLGLPCPCDHPCHTPPLTTKE